MEPYSILPALRNSARNPLLDLFVGQCFLLINRAVRGLPCDPRSLKNLARVAEELAATEEKAA